MLKTLRLSFALKNTYRVNSILYAIKQTPLLEKIIPSTVYQMQGFKIFANVLSVIWEILSVFLGKILYVYLMIAGVAGVLNLPLEAGARVFLHMLFFLSIIGATANTYLFNPTKDKYYAMILLGMNAREYTLIQYFYAIIKLLAGFALCAFLLGLPMGLSVWQCLLVPIFVAGVKMVYAARQLFSYEKYGTVNNENKLSKLWWIVLLLLFGAAYGLPALGFMLPETVSVILMCVGVLLGLFSMRKILTFVHYRPMYKELLANEVIFNPVTTLNIQQEQSRSTIRMEKGVTSTRKGFEYLNELFIRRHQKLLWKSAKRTAAVALVIMAAAWVALKVMPEINTDINGMLLSCMPYLVFIMYAINRGSKFTQVLFINCDHSLLTYSFYKQPNYIVKLFWIRLREITKVNLLPAAAIGAGLVLLLYTSGGTDNPMNYAVLFVSVVVLSIFFSVHYLVLYYLLQPYNAGTEIKSGAYRIATSGTYVICYMIMQLKVPTQIFGTVTIAFCVAYCIVASILIYRLAPKTFRIRT